MVTSATEVGNTRPNSASNPESVARIHEVCFYSLTTSSWDDLPPETLTNPEAIDSMMMRDNYGQPAAQVFEHPCMPLTKILSSGSFYYALDSTWDISSRLAVRLSRDRHATWDLGTFDERFIWNAFLIRSLLEFRERLDPLERREFDTCQFIVCQSMFLLASLAHGLGRSWPSKGMSGLPPWRFPHRQRMDRLQLLLSPSSLVCRGNVPGRDSIRGV